MSTLSQFKANVSYKGTYAGGTTYYLNDIVTDGVKSYICKVATSVGVAVSNTTNWGVMVDSGVVSVANTGTGTNPSTFTLSASGSTVTLNRVA